MMKPTDEQLRDQKWWDESTSKDAVGCWVVTEDDGRFVKTVFVHDPREGVVMNELQRAKYFSRPTKPAAPEWDGESWPIPVGTECECEFCGRWVRGKIIAHARRLSGIDCIYETDCDWDFHDNVKYFRPIPTKKQQEINDLVALIDAHEPYTSDELAKAILDKYQPKERDND